MLDTAQPDLVPMLLASAAVSIVEDQPAESDDQPAEATLASQWVVACGIVGNEYDLIVGPFDTYNQALAWTQTQPTNRAVKDRPWLSFNFVYHVREVQPPADHIVWH